jgi:hypothetical protein
VIDPQNLFSDISMCLNIKINAMPRNLPNSMFKKQLTYQVKSTLLFPTFHFDNISIAAL